MKCIENSVLELRTHLEYPHAIDVDGHESKARKRKCDFNFLINAWLTFWQCHHAENTERPALDWFGSSSATKTGCNHGLNGPLEIKKNQIKGGSTPHP